jgi:hypothetical protein
MCEEKEKKKKTMKRELDWASTHGFPSLPSTTPGTLVVVVVVVDAGVAAVSSVRAEPLTVVFSSSSAMLSRL